MNNYYFNDPLLGGNNNTPLSPEIAKIQQEYLQRIQAVQATGQNQGGTPTPIWDEIDKEINSMSDIQKRSLEQNDEFKEASMSVQMLVNEHMLSIIKPRIEQTENGRNALQNQLSLVKKLKKGIMDQTDRELEEFRKWKEQNKTK